MNVSIRRSGTKGLAAKRRSWTTEHATLQAAGEPISSVYFSSGMASLVFPMSYGMETEVTVAGPEGVVSGQAVVGRLTSSLRAVLGRPSVTVDDHGRRERS